MSEGVTENNTSETLVPSLFVDKYLLECNINSNKDTSKYFIIGDKVFEDEQMMPENNYVKFQMFATKRCEIAENMFVGDQDDEEYCLTQDNSSDDDEYSWTQDKSSDDEEYCCTQDEPTDDEVSPNEQALYHHMHMQTTSQDIRGSMLCTLCNVIVPATMKYSHIQEPNHRYQQHKSLNMSDKNQTASTNNEETRSNGNQSTFSYRNNDISPHSVYKNNDSSIGTSDSAIVTDAKSNKDGATATEDILKNSIEPIIDLDSYVFVKIANVYLKISIMSFNTLVVVGDGWSRYCLVCSTKIGIDVLKIHINSRGHKENLSQCKYVDLCEGSMLRQMHFMYHCGTCNVLLTRKTLNYHMAWSSHIEEWETATSTSNKARKKAIKSGISLITATPRNETLNLQEDLPTFKILYKVRFKQNDGKDKIVIINDVVFKISFDHWHGVTTRAKFILTCIICQCDIKDVTKHTETESHLECLKKPFYEVDYCGELLREVNKSILHCVTCNVPVMNTHDFIFDHISGKKHKKNYQAMKEFSTKSDSFIDCED